MANADVYAPRRHSRRRGSLRPGDSEPRVLEAQSGRRYQGAVASHTDKVSEPAPEEVPRRVFSFQVSCMPCDYGSGSASDAVNVAAKPERFNSFHAALLMEKRDRPQHLAYMREYVNKRKDDRKSSALKRLGGACAHCGENEGLEFDHIDPETKLDNLSCFWRSTEPLFEAELAKCQLLCKPCHRIKSAEEARERRVIVHGTLNAYQRYGCRCDLCAANRRAYRRNLYETHRSKGKRGLLV